jgi:hypothetical protein
MSIADLSALAEIIAAVAVVITLVYLARQIQQANGLARAQTRQRMVEQAQHEVYKGFVEEPSILRSLYKSEPLSETEWIQLSGWLLAAMRQREYEWFQMRDGNIDEGLWRAYRGIIPIHLGSSRIRNWWVTWGSAPFDPSFCAMVAELLDSIPEGNYFEQFEKIVSASEPGPSVQPYGSS